MKKLFIFLGIVAIVAFSYYAISPLFINIKIDESAPISEELREEMPAESFSTEPAPIVPTPAHPASGTARIVSNNDTRYLRYENFKTINGPDIYVYLAKDLSAKEFVNLGKVRATEGNVNYQIPSNVDPREYPYALIWCKVFGVLFNSARLY